MKFMASHRKLVSMMICFIMLVNMLPVSTFAVDDVSTQTSSAVIEETVKTDVQPTPAAEAAVTAQETPGADGAETTPAEGDNALTPAAPEGAPEEPAAGEDAPEEPAVEEGTPEEPAVEEGAPEEPAVEEGTPEEPAVEEGAPEEPAAEEGTPEESAAEDAAASVSVSGKILWVNRELQEEASRPVSVTLTLYANGEAGESIAVSAPAADAAEWPFSFGEKPAQDAEGGDIAYTVAEAAVADYAISYDGLTVTNTYAPAVVEGGTVTNEAMAAPTQTKSSVDHIDIACENLSVTIGTETYTFSFTPTDVTNGLVEVYINGTRYTSAAGYSTDSAGRNQVRISGTFAVGTKDSPVEYTVVVKKMVTTEKYGTVYLTLSVSSNYWASNNVCPGKKGDTVSDQAGIDVVMGSGSAAYTRLDISKVVAGDLDLTENKTYVFEIRDSSGKVVKEVSVEVHADGSASTTIVTGLAAGTYTVVEKESSAAVDGYKLTVSYSAQTVTVTASSPVSVTVTNTYEIDTLDISGSKTWDDNNNQDGKRPGSITINLLADGVKVDSATVTAENGWAWSFTGLPKFGTDGGEIVYTVSEEAVEGYTPVIDGYNVTNVHVPEKVSVSGAKSWDDANNQDGKRPDSITIHLFANGVEIASKVVTEADGWAWNFGELDKYADGAQIQYTVTEDAVDGYTSAVSGYNVTNTHEPEKTEVSGSKTWNDNNDQDGKRPESITIHLFANGTEVASKVVTAADGWAWSFTDLDKYAEGEEIVYTITEDVVDGYTAAVNGYDVTNTHEIEKTRISGSKTWNDNNNQDGKRPESITINLLADGVKIASKTVTAADGWVWSFINLDVYKDGVEIVYTVTEEAVDGYTATVSGYDVTNTHEIEKTEVSGSKTWADNNDQDGKRPESITIHLLANGEEVASKTVTAADGWAWTFTDLDKYANGTEIVYTITEDAVADYETTVNGYNVTNTHEIEKISVSGSKTWVDNDNQDGKRPASITIHLLANGKEVASKTVTAADGWAWTFEDVDKYADGAEIVYTVTEDAVEGYETTVSGLNVTNTHEIEKISVSGSKTWADNNDQDGKRPAFITIRLYADGVEVASKTVNAADGWTWTFENLDKYDDGREIVYTVSEDAVADYEATVNGYDVTNTHEIEKTEVEVSKVWDDANNQDGIRTNDIIVKLLANGKDTGKTLVLSSGNSWTDSFTDLDKYAGGQEIVYTVAEITVDGYTTSITGTQADGYTITNTHTPANVEISGSKTWADEDNQDGKRPDSITINLLKNGEIIDSKIVTEADGWAWTFSGLPKYENQGVEIVYSITETAVEDYTTTYDGYNVTNSYTPEQISITVTKSWQDNNDQDGLRPDSITVKLLADGKDTGKTLVLSAENNWTGSFTELDKFAAGVEIVYTIEEVEVEGYDTVITGDVTAGYTITNSHIPELTVVSGSKTWADEDNQDGKRPESITIRLWADGVEVDSVTVTEAEGWAWSFTDLPKYAAGELIIYSITEDAVEDYTTTYDGYDVTNSYTPEEISITVVKAWADSKNADGKRPDEVTIILLADGEDTGRRLVLTADGSWTGSFTGLPKYADGELIEYTIDEVKVDGYNTVIRGDMSTGFTVTNSRTNIPQTGDERTPMLWIGLMMASMFTFACAIVPMAKKKGDKSAR